MVFFFPNRDSKNYNTRYGTASESSVGYSKFILLLIVLCVIGLILAIGCFFTGKKFGKAKRTNPVNDIEAAQGQMAQNISPNTKYMPVPK
ncbi:unnamed protein product [Adineta steineri]|uniref:Uncharacterized protein n=1 Tax=Adineta steineri TaxID=433720 RepID=A0A814APD2_9BILA|nr:unnamed protein product [Adineta steineri]CAF0914939.1 unnamed protein product [Adineta steineri]